jgi:hypothetical protein
MRSNAASRWLGRVGAGALAIGLTGSALAQGDAQVEPGRESRVARTGSLARVSVLPVGFGMQLGGGVTAFTGAAAADMLGTGAYWDLRAVLGTRSFLGAELAYVGSARQVTAAGFDASSMIGNGAEAVVRANLPLQLQAVRLVPFAFGGFGWTGYQLMSADPDGPGVANEAKVITIPVGVGVGVSYQNFTVDARFTYRPAFEDDLVTRPGDDSAADLESWAAGVTVGYEI